MDIRMDHTSEQMHWRGIDGWMRTECKYLFGNRVAFSIRKLLCCAADQPDDQPTINNIGQDQRRFKAIKIRIWTDFGFSKDEIGIGCAGHRCLLIFRGLIVDLQYWSVQCPFDDYDRFQSRMTAEQTKRLRMKLNFIKNGEWNEVNAAVQCPHCQFASTRMQPIGRVCENAYALLDWHSRSPAHENVNSSQVHCPILNLCVFHTRFGFCLPHLCVVFILLPSAHRDVHEELILGGNHFHLVCPLLLLLRNGTHHRCVHIVLIIYSFSRSFLFSDLFFSVALPLPAGSLQMRILAVSAFSGMNFHVTVNEINRQRCAKLFPHYLRHKTAS